MSHQPNPAATDPNMYRELQLHTAQNWQTCSVLQGRSLTMPASSAALTGTTARKPVNTHPNYHASLGSIICP
jgi:hypothetical protein